MVLAFAGTSLEQALGGRCSNRSSMQFKSPPIMMSCVFRLCNDHIGLWTVVSWLPSHSRRMVAFKKLPSPKVSKKACSLNRMRESMSETHSRSEFFFRSAVLRDAANIFSSPRLEIEIREYRDCMRLKPRISSTKKRRQTQLCRTRVWLTPSEKREPIYN